MKDEQLFLGREAPAPNTGLASILAVDDDARNLLALRELLDAPGREVVTVRSGADALARVVAQDFALILLDARMPVMDGFECAKRIRELPRSRHTPILFLTGAYEDSPSMFRGYEAGAVDYLVKPLVPEILRSKVAVFVELYGKNAVLEREVAERKRAESDLRSSQEKLRALAAHLQSVREEEWRKIAREIHDELGQALTGMKMDLAWVAGRLQPGQRALADKARAMGALIDRTVHSVRKLASRLRPEVLDELGLAAAIQWQARDFQKRAGIRCKVSVPELPVELDQERATAAFRVFQELLTNVARHAEATAVEILLQSEDGVLILEVNDNGKGMDAAAAASAKSLGLLGMHERILPFGGTLEFGQSGGKGTRVIVHIPFAAGARSSSIKRSSVEGPREVTS